MLRKNRIRRRKRQATPATQERRPTLVDMGTAAALSRLTPFALRALIRPESGEPTVRTAMVRGRIYVVWSDLARAIRGGAAR